MPVERFGFSVSLENGASFAHNYCCFCVFAFKIFFAEITPRKLVPWIDNPPLLSPTVTLSPPALSCIIYSIHRNVGKGNQIPGSYSDVKDIFGIQILLLFLQHSCYWALSFFTPPQESSVKSISKLSFCPCLQRLEKLIWKLCLCL